MILCRSTWNYRSPRLEPLHIWVFDLAKYAVRAIESMADIGESVVKITGEILRRGVILQRDIQIKQLLGAGMLPGKCRRIEAPVS